MARRRKRQGYNKRAHGEHAGVSIQIRHGIAVLRWMQPGERTAKGALKQYQQRLTDKDGNFITSREAAKPYAVAKAEELKRERARLTVGGRPIDANVTWKALQDGHTQHLNAKNRSRKTVEDYQQTWKALESWRTKPKYPKDVTISNLEGYIRFQREREFANGRKLSPHSVAHAARHLKAILNYGRKHLSCVKLDAEAVATGLDFGRLPKPAPVALTTTQLIQILETAKAHDIDHPDQAVFPLLAFFMLTGCRRGEAENLRFALSSPKAHESWCDFEGGRLLIWGTKTGHHRTLSFGTRPRLKSLLETLLRERAKPEWEPFVFGNHLPLAIATKRQEPNPENEEGRRTGKRLKSAIESVRNDCGVKFALKDFRSTNATFLANSNLGLNLYTLAGELGHDYAVLVKHYAGHRALSDEQAKAATVSDVLGIGAILDAWLAEKDMALRPLRKVMGA